MADVKSKKSDTVLVVDDTPKNIQVLGTILREEGFNINVATNGKEAIETANKVNPDIILLDIMMPEMDGFEACKLLKQNEKTAHIPIIFLTAKTEAEDILKGFELGANDYVTKPFNSAELLARVKTHLELVQGRNELKRQSMERKILLQVITHDLTNPLVGLKGIVELLESLQDISELQEFLPFLKTGVDNSLGIVELIRTMQSIDNQDKQWNLVHLNVENCLNEACNNLIQKYENKNISVTQEIGAEDCIIAEKTSFIQSVLSNVLDNCYKFTYENGSIHIKGYEDEEQNYVLSFRDNGIGMSEKLLGDALDIESKTNRPGTKGEVGTGYGFPLVQKFMQIYSGRIEMESSDEKDNSFTEVRLYFQLGSKDQLTDR